MRDYGKIAASFWTGATGRELRGDPWLWTIAAFLVTGPEANMIGLYPAPIPTICHWTGCSLEGASKALRSLRGLDFAYYDDLTSYVWVKEAARFQIDERLKDSDHRIMGVINELLLHKGTSLFRDFVARYREPFALDTARRWPEIERVIASPLKAPSKPGAGTGAGTGEEDLPPPTASVPPSPGGRMSGASDRGTAWKDEYLTDEWRAIVTGFGLDPAVVLPEFADYWRGVPGIRGRKKDWPGTLRNRCRELVGRAKSRGNGRGGYDGPTAGEVEKMIVRHLSDVGRKKPADPFLTEVFAQLGGVMAASDMPTGVRLGHLHRLLPGVKVKRAG